MKPKLEVYAYRICRKSHAIFVFQYLQRVASLAYCKHRYAIGTFKGDLFIDVVNRTHIGRIIPAD